MTVRDNDGSIVQFSYGDDGIDVMENKYLDKFKFLERNHNTIFKNIDKFLSEGAVEIEPIEKAKSKIRREMKRMMKKDENLTALQAQYKASDPLISIFHPQRHFGSISEKMEHQIEKYIASESVKVNIEKEGKRALRHKFPIIEPDEFKKMYYLKYLKSLVHAGENVGTIAAQSIGEPST
jgi:DNA-directed RNA polymerase I subunit RPA1